MELRLPWYPAVQFANDRQSPGIVVGDINGDPVAIEDTAVRRSHGKGSADDGPSLGVDE
jgi:hypothetical protein